MLLKELMDANKGIPELDMKDFFKTLDEKIKKYPAGSLSKREVVKTIPISESFDKGLSKTEIDAMVSAFDKAVTNALNFELKKQLRKFGKKN